MSSTDETHYFLSQDGLRIYYRHWDCEQASKICCIVHGLGEHSNRYEHIARELNREGVTVFAMDLRGHGLSQGKKGHVKNYDLFMSDIEELLKTARSTYTELPMYLMGHSMGGNLVANYVLNMSTNELVGFILSSPWFKLAFAPPAWKLKLGSFFNSVYPALTQPSGLDISKISRDKNVVQAYIDDPLIHDRISAGLHTAITEAGTHALTNAHAVKLRGLAFHGTSDQVIDWNASSEFASQSDQITFHPLDQMYHEPLNDIGNSQVIGLVKEFIREA